MMMKPTSRIVHFLCLLTLAPAVLPALAAGPAAGAAVRKHLPLDGVPNVVMKTPANSAYAADRIIVKLAPNVAGVRGANSFGVAAVDNFIRRYAPRDVRAMFPQHASPGLPSGQAGQSAGRAGGTEAVDLTK